MIRASEITVEKNVPLPSRGNAAGIGILGILRSLEVGDSFIYPGKGIPTNVIGYAKRVGIKVATRKQVDGKYRVWRVEDEANGAEK